MLNFLKLKNNSLDFYAPSSGTLLKIEQISDPVFSSKMLGDGYGIEPTSGRIHSPVFGIVTSVFPTKHAIGIKTNIGDEILLHIGIDTVELKGAPFEIFVKVGDKVMPNKEIMHVDFDQLDKLKKTKTIIVVYTNRPSVEEFDSLKKKEVLHGEKIGKLSE